MARLILFVRRVLILLQLDRVLVDLSGLTEVMVWQHSLNPTSAG